MDNGIATGVLVGFMILAMFLAVRIFGTSNPDIKCEAYKDERVMRVPARCLNYWIVNGE